MANKLSGLCNGCIEFYRKFIFCLLPLVFTDSQLTGSAAAIPKEFMGNPTILELLNGEAVPGSCTLGVGESLSLRGSSILANAVTYQESASESRIGVQVRH